MAKEWKVQCKDCGKDFGYSDSSYQEGASRGLSRPERCPDCRKKHNRQTATMGLSYFPLRPRAASDTSEVHAGQLGAVSHERRIHEIYDLPSTYDPAKFGITDDDVAAIFDWLGNPKHQVVVVEGPTGSGKSTVLPFKLIQPPDGFPKDEFTRHGQIVVTQPRIRATEDIPGFVAKTLYGSNVGSGFDIGFRNSENPASDWRNKLVYVTDGTLINWIVNGQIANLSLIMIDEAHERSLNIDLILGLLKKLLPRYPYLKLIIASATINPDLFIDYFGRESAGHVKFKGLQIHFVKEFYRFDGSKSLIAANEYCPDDNCGQLPYEDMSKMRNLAATEVAKVVVWLLETIADGSRPQGDILAFLHGEKPIQDAVGLIRQAVEGNPDLSNVYVCPLYTTLPREDQYLALIPKPDPSKRRVVVTTNVAETSLTIEGITYVVDSGLINQEQWDPNTQTKQVIPVLQSKAGCKQRWGRAGRITDGEAYCLYTEEQFNTPSLFPEYTVAQIKRSPLEQIVLTSKAAGIDDIETFDWIEKPLSEEMKRASEILKKKGALDSEGYLTEHGLELQAFGEEPNLANLMIVADRFCCAVEMATLLPMIKVGGLRYFLRWDRGWDAETRRRVRKVHESLMKGCQDDIEFCLKMYVAWSEHLYDGQPLDPTWSFRAVWPKRIPRLTDEMRAKLKSESLRDFAESVESISSYDNLLEILTQYGLDEMASAWLADANLAITRSSQEAWARAYYVNHSIFRDKIEPQRSTLLEALSGHKKDDVIRPIDFSLIDRVRILLAYCLPERICENPHNSDIPVEEYSEGYPNQLTYKLRGLGLVDEAAQAQTRMPVKINLDSVLYEKSVNAFVSCKQQVIKHRLLPTTPPEPIIHSSFISIVNPEWIKWLEKQNPSHTSLARFLSEQTRNQSGKLLAAGTYDRLFMDLKYPLGSRYVCKITRILDQNSADVMLVSRLSDLPQIHEEYRRTESESGAQELEMEDANQSDSDFPSVALIGMPEPTKDPDEEVTPAWVDLSDDAYDIDLPGNGDGDEIDSDRRNLRRPFVRSTPLGTTESEIPGSLPKCRLLQMKQGYRQGKYVTVEVSGYDYDDSTLLLHPVPDKEPFEVFLDNFVDPAAELSLRAIDYEARPGDYQIALVTEESKSAIEILLEPEQLGFSSRGFVVKEIPIGTELRCTVESIDKAHGRVHVSCLPTVEAHLNKMIGEKRINESGYLTIGLVREVFRGKVYLVCAEFSEPAQGIIHVAEVIGKGLYKSADDYQVGDSCRIRLNVQKYPSHVRLSKLPDEVAKIIDKQSTFNNLSWNNGELGFIGRMTYRLKAELKEFSNNKSYSHAIDGLYRFSNQLRGNTLNPSWEGPPLRTRISEAKVLRILNFGLFVDIGNGLEGLVRKNDISWLGVSDPSDAAQVGDKVDVIVIKVDADNQEIGLTMRMPEQAPDYKKYKIGEILTGQMAVAIDSGILVELDPGVKGLVRNREIWGHRPTVGEGTMVRVLEVDEQEHRILLTMKIPENNALLVVREGDRVPGTVEYIKEGLGAFIRIDSGITGLVHISKLTRTLNPGETVEVLVLRINATKYELGLGL